MNILQLLFVYLLTFSCAYFVSAKTKVWFQVASCLLCGGVLIMAWSDGSYFDTGVFWVYSGWIGYLFYKVERGVVLGAIVGRVSNSIKNAVMSVVNRWNRMVHGMADKIFPNRSSRNNQQEEEGQERSQASSESTHQSHSNTHQDERGQQYWQQQEEFNQRQQARAESQRQQQQENQKQKEASAPKPKRPWWEVLEVSKNADLETIKKAHRTMAKRYHPDKVAHFGEAFRAEAEETAKEINAAYDEAKKRKS